MCSNSHGSDAIVPSLLFCDEASDNVQFDDDIVKEVMTTTSNPSLMKRFFLLRKPNRRCGIIQNCVTILLIMY